MGENVKYGAAAGKNMCVSCQTDVEGKKAFPIAEDRVIRGIRAVKKALGVAQMNKLYVCEACMPKHMERRRSFEKTMLFASVLAGIMLIIMIIAPIWNGRFEAFAFISGFIVAGFIVFLPVLFKYVPAVEGVNANAKAFAGGLAKQAAQPPAQPPAPAVPTDTAEKPGAKEETPKKKKTKKK